MHHKWTFQAHLIVMTSMWIVLTCQISLLWFGTLTVVVWVQQTTQTLDTPEEPALTLNTVLLLIETRCLNLWPVVTRSRGLMSNMSMLGGADELLVRRMRQMSLMRWIKPASFLSKLMELSSFLWPITICLYPVSLSALVMQGNQRFGTDIWPFLSQGHYTTTVW